MPTDNFPNYQFKSQVGADSKRSSQSTSPLPRQICGVSVRNGSRPCRARCLLTITPTNKVVGDFSRSDSHCSNHPRPCFSHVSSTAPARRLTYPGSDRRDHIREGSSWHSIRGAKQREQGRCTVLSYSSAEAFALSLGAGVISHYALFVTTDPVRWGRWLLVCCVFLYEASIVVVLFFFNPPADG